MAVTSNSQAPRRSKMPTIIFKFETQLRRLVFVGFKLILPLTTIVQSSNHHCIDNTVSSIAIPFDSEQPERLLTNIRDQDRYLASQRCTWEIWIKDLVEARQLVLQLTSKPMVSSKTEYDSRLTMQFKDNDGIILDGFNHTWYDGQGLPVVPLILPYKLRSHKLVVTFNTGESPPSDDCPRVELTITMAKKGFCGWSMLLHRFHCYLVTDSNISMSHERGSGLKLAGFSGVTQLRELLRDNDLRRELYPYKPPLNLNSPVRIGVFRCPGSEQLSFHWKFKNGKCVSVLFNTSRFRVYGKVSTSPQCGSIRIDSSSNINLEFTNCSIPMRSLLSFIELPTGSALSIPAGVDENHCENQLEFICKNNESRPEWGMFKATLIPVVLLFIVGIIASVFMTRRFLLRRRRRNYSQRREAMEPFSDVPDGETNTAL